MCRFALHFFLILSLLFNGISASWAMPGMHHAGAMQGHHPVSELEADAQPHGHEHHATDTAADFDAAETSCCDDATCQCGCVLPPALIFPPLPPLSRGEAFTAMDVLEQHTVAVRGSPPYRPPTA